MLPEKIYLIDKNKELTNAWTEAFQSERCFEVVEGDYFSRPADAMVSPANSFGIMDGGLDLAIRDNVGYETEEKLKQVILAKYHGELPVGSAEIVETINNKWPFLISAPTMRVPMDVSNTLNAYISFRAILLTVRSFNAAPDIKKKIKSIVCSGLGTGIGCMTPRKCAAQMRVAYSYISKPARIPSFSEIHEVHRKLNVVV